MFVLVVYKVEQAGAVDVEDPRIHAVVGRDDPIKVDKDPVDDRIKIPAVLASEHVVLHAPNALTWNGAPGPGIVGFHGHPPAQAVAHVEGHARAEAGGLRGGGSQEKGRKASLVVLPV